MSFRGMKRRMVNPNYFLKIKLEINVFPSLLYIFVALWHSSDRILPISAFFSLSLSLSLSLFLSLSFPLSLSTPTELGIHGGNKSQLMVSNGQGFGFSTHAISTSGSGSVSGSSSSSGSLNNYMQVVTLQRMSCDLIESYYYNPSGSPSYYCHICLLNSSCTYCNSLCVSNGGNRLLLLPLLLLLLLLLLFPSFFFYFFFSYSSTYVLFSYSIAFLLCLFSYFILKLSFSSPTHRIPYQTARQTRVRAPARDTRNLAVRTTVTTHKASVWPVTATPTSLANALLSYGPATHAPRTA